MWGGGTSKVLSKVPHWVITGFLQLVSVHSSCVGFHDPLFQILSTGSLQGATLTFLLRRVLSSHYPSLSPGGLSGLFLLCPSVSPVKVWFW